MSPNRTLLLLAAWFLLGIFSAIQAQSPTERRANALYRNFAYTDARLLYEHIYRKDPENVTVLRKLAECSRKLQDHAATETWTLQLIEKNQAEANDYLYLAMAQEALGKKEALQNYTLYTQKAAGDPRGARYQESLNQYQKLFALSDCYRVQRLTVNSTGSDFSPAYFQDGPQRYLVVCSNGFDALQSRSVFPWNNRKWLDLWKIPMTNDSSPEPALILSNKLNTRYHEGPVCWDATHQTLAFTRNAYHQRKVTRSSDRVNKLKLYFSTYQNQQWQAESPFAYNSPEYSTGHPAFSTDGNTLWFVSDMPGGLGGTDLYRCRREGNGWSKPENLGANVNTPGNEMFPSVWNDTLLYFASDGWGGLGGLDILSSSLIPSKDSLPENLGSPINGPGDDFGLIMAANGRSGFFSSNGGNSQSDDVYRFTYSPRPSIIRIRDKESLKGIANAQIEVFEDGTRIRSFKSTSEGLSSMILKPCRTYRFHATAEGYPQLDETIKTACDKSEARDVNLLVRKPAVHLKLLDKYQHNDPIVGAVYSLVDITAGSADVGLEESNDKGEARFTLTPCHEYEVTASKKGIPSVKKTFKAPCTGTEEDVYSTLFTGNPPPKGTIVRIVVVDEQSGAPVPMARLKMTDPASGTTEDLLTEETGFYEIVIPEGKLARFQASRIGYFATSKSKGEALAKSGNKPVELTLKLLKLTEGGIIALEGIFYDLKKTDIRPDAAKVLDYVVSVMQENPGMVIELGSHTDARGSDADNLKLSDGRAHSAADYIISKGIDASRITGKGYGESRLKNKCGNGVKCPESEHQINRRTEIRIVEFNE
jgi:outer membrane protein OmpA-like peptidoglycan-associated protein/tetratricopeptide (TPR) repeat protein